MAGSMKWFVYTTDAGDDFALWRDESNLEVVNAGTQDMPDTPTVTYSLPRNVKPRLARFASADGLVTRNIVCLTSTIFDGLGAGSSYTDPVSTKTLTLTAKVGESIRLPVGVDSGLTDGDAS
jgi:hypothetical protein